MGPLSKKCVGKKIVGEIKTNNIYKNLYIEDKQRTEHYCG